MKVNSNSKHIKNRIYKQFQDSIYDKAPVPAGYDLLFDYDNHESGFVGKVYIKENHIVPVLILSGDILEKTVPKSAGM